MLSEKYRFWPWTLNEDIWLEVLFQTKNYIFIDRWEVWWKEKHYRTTWKAVLNHKQVTSVSRISTNKIAIARVQSSSCIPMAIFQDVYANPEIVAEN